MSSVSRFIGFSIEEPLYTNVLNVQAQLRGDKELRKPLSPHLTVITPPMMKKLEEVDLASVVQSVGLTEAITAELLGVELFYRRVAFLGIGSDPLKRAQQDILEYLGLRHHIVKPIGRALYRPHITIAQARGGVGLSKENIELIHSVDYGQQTTLKNLHVYEHIAPRQYQITQSVELS